MMTRDYMDRPVELIILDACLAVKIENIINILDENMREPLVLALGRVNADKIARVHSIVAAAEKNAALHLVSRAHNLNLISYDDWYRIYEIISNMDVGDR